MSGVAHSPGNTAGVCNNLQKRKLVWRQERRPVERRTWAIPEPIAAHLAATVLCPDMSDYRLHRDRCPPAFTSRCERAKGQLTVVGRKRKKERVVVDVGREDAAAAVNI